MSTSQGLQQSPFASLPAAKPDTDEAYFNYLVAGAITGLTANDGTADWSNDDYAENAIGIAECVQRRLKNRRANRPGL